MLCGSFLDEKIELSGSCIRFDLAIPTGMLILNEPLAQARKRPVIEMLNLLFNPLNVSHAVLRSAQRLPSESPRPRDSSVTARSIPKGTELLDWQKAIPARMKQRMAVGADNCKIQEARDDLRARVSQLVLVVNLQDSASEAIE